MPYVDFIAALALLQFFFFGAMTGAARRKSGLKAPAVTGDEHFERMYRVQMNTLETLVAFLPALLMAAKYWSAPLVAGIGAVYLIGRLLYWRAYIADPTKRALGFFLSVLPAGVLIIMALIGAVLAL